MLLSEQITEIARNVNRPSVEISAQAIALLDAWQRNWNTRWPYADYLETSAYFATVANQQTYALSANVAKPYAFWIPQHSYRLDRLVDEQLRAIGASATYGIPTAFSLFGDNQANLYPIPSSANISVYYSFFKKLSNFNSSGTLSAQESEIDPKYHDAGVWHATKVLAIRMGDMDLKAQAEAEYEMAYEIAKQDMVARVGGTNRVRVAGEQIGGITEMRTKADTLFYGE